jgi:hypothetical protein
MSEVTVQQHAGTSGCVRESWRFTLSGGVLTLRGYAREMLPSKRHRKWMRVEEWGNNRQADNTMPKEEVPMNNALASDILANIALSLEISHDGLSLPSLGYRLVGADDEKVASSG